MRNDLGSRLLALSRSFMHSRVFLTAIELGIFRALGSDRLNADELAERVGAEPRALEILANALVSMSLLEKKEDRFGNVPFSLEEIAANDGTNFEAFLHAVHLWEQWSELTNIVRGTRAGHPLPQPELARAGALAMRQYAKASADALAQTIGGPGVHRLLDLGGGAGTFSIALAMSCPQLSAVVFDANPEALAMAREEIAARGLEERVTTRQGTFVEDELGHGFDLVLISSVMCLLGEDENRRLLARVRDALVPGGEVVIRDAILDPSATAPPQFALFSINMLVTTAHGKAYTHQEISTWLTDTGFTRIQRLPLQDARLIIARTLGEFPLERPDGRAN